MWNSAVEDILDGNDRGKGKKINVDVVACGLQLVVLSVFAVVLARGSSPVRFLQAGPP